MAGCGYGDAVAARSALSISTEPRGGHRHKVFLPAEMTEGDRAGRAHLLNLSMTGALLHADAAPSVGAVVQLTVGATRWPVRVVWSQDKRFGVVHVTPLARAAVEALVAQRR